MSAIKAVIATQFDATGIKKATKEFGKLGSSLKGTLGAVGVGIGLSAIVSQLKEFGKAAAGDAKSAGLLAQQLRNTVGASDAAIAGAEKFINALQMQTSIADDDLRPALANLVRATGDVGRAQDLLKLSTDVAAGSGKDLGAVSIAIGKAVNGQTTSLKKLGIVIKDGQDPVAVLTKQFDGMAAAAANLDPFQRLSIIFQDIQEQLGYALLPTLQDFASWFTSPEGIAQTKAFVDVLKDMIMKLVDAVKWIAANIKWLGPLAAGIGILTASLSILNIVMSANPYVLLAEGLVAIGVALVGVSNRAQQAGKDMMGLDSATSVYMARNPFYGKQNKAASQIGSHKGDAGLAEALKLKKQQDYFAQLLGGNSGSNSKVAKATKKATDTTAKALANLTEQFKTDIADLTQGFADLSKSSKDLGQFEQSAISVFDSIDARLKKAIADKVITSTAADYIYNYIAVEKVALTALAKQRDVLLAKIDIAKSISQQFVDAANITSTETKQVTKSVETLVNGIKTTLTSTYDEVIAGDITGSFKKIVEKTKAFAKNLVSLKKLGLNGTLFKQIVDAGTEAGGATAEALIAGGADTVKELNGLFDELNQAGSDIAQESTDTFYSLGEGVSNAFIDGLKSQEQYLADEIAKMVASIEAAFADMMARLNTLKTASPGYTQSDVTFDAINQAAQMSGTTGFTGELRQMALAGMNSGTINVTVNAGLGTNGKAVGQQITSLLNQYTKANA